MKKPIKEYSIRIIDYYEKNWHLLSEYHKDHFSIRALRSGNNSKIFTNHLQDICIRTNNKLHGLTTAIKNGGASYTIKTIQEPRYINLNKTRKNFLFKNPKYLAINDYLWNIYTRHQVKCPIRIDTLPFKISYLTDLEDLLGIFASRYLNNIYCISDILNINFDNEKQKAYKKIQNRNLEFTQIEEVVNYFYLLTHVVINESLFYQRFTGNKLRRMVNWEKIFSTLLFDKIINSNETKNIKKIDILAETIVCLYLLNLSKNFTKYSQCIENLLDKSRDQFLSITNEHTHALIMMVKFILYDTKNYSIPFYSINSQK